MSFISLIPSINEYATATYQNVLEWEKNSSPLDTAFSFFPIVGTIVHVVKEIGLNKELCASSSADTIVKIIDRKNHCKILGNVAGLISQVTGIFFLLIGGFGALFGALLFLTGISEQAFNLYSALNNDWVKQQISPAGYLSSGTRLSDLNSKGVYII